MFGHRKRSGPGHRSVARTELHRVLGCCWRPRTELSIKGCSVLAEDPWADLGINGCLVLAEDVSADPRIKGCLVRPEDPLADLSVKGCLVTGPYGASVCSVHAEDP